MGILDGLLSQAGDNLNLDDLGESEEEKEEHQAVGIVIQWNENWLEIFRNFVILK